MEKRTKKKEQDGQQESLEHQSLEVSMLNKDSFSDEELESYLSKGAIRASDEITVPPKILFVPLRPLVISAHQLARPRVRKPSISQQW